MQHILRSTFSHLKIEYYALLPYSFCTETLTHLRERMGFVPRSVIVYLLPYYTGEGENISRYAVSRDYHIAIREIGDNVISALMARYPEASFSSFGDHSPIDERRAALISGLGVLGDNGLLINEKYGSYVFIGEIITDLEPCEPYRFTPAEIKRCHSCGACKVACPTGFLTSQTCECLSAITQRRGELSEGEAALMRRLNTAWGCDVCQSVCPYNRNPAETPLEFFHRDRIPLLTRQVLDSMDNESFSHRAYAWRGRKTVERNLKILDTAEER